MNPTLLILFWYLIATYLGILLTVLDDIKSKDKLETSILAISVSVFIFVFLPFFLIRDLFSMKQWLFTNQQAYNIRVFSEINQEKKS